MSTAQADRLILELLYSRQVPSEEVRDVIRALRGALITKIRGESFRTELERSLRPNGFVTAARQAQPMFYKNVRELPNSRDVSAEPADVARNPTLTIKVIIPIWPVTRTAISDSYR